MVPERTWGTRFIGTAKLGGMKEKHQGASDVCH